MRRTVDSKKSASRRQREVPLTQHFNKRLTAYASAAGAACVGVLSLARPARGDIFVNNSPISIGVNTTVDLQINGVTQLIFSDLAGITSRLGSTYAPLAVSASATSCLNPIFSDISCRALREALSLDQAGRSLREAL
jgi:hypothetical protein